MPVTANLVSQALRESVECQFRYKLAHMFSPARLFGLRPSGLFDWFNDKWLVSGQALKLFCISTLFVAALAPIFFGLVNFAKPSPLERLLWGFEGVFGPISLFFLWIGMWRYWVRLDTSTPALKTASFFLLLVGAWFGAIPYCFFVYRPQVLRRTWARPFPDDDDDTDQTARPQRRKSIIIWATSLCLAALIFAWAIPRLIQRFGSEEYLYAYLAIASMLGLCLGIGLLFGYPLTQLFRLGMKRRRRAPGQ